MFFAKSSIFSGKGQGIALSQPTEAFVVADEEQRLSKDGFIIVLGASCSYCNHDGDVRASIAIRQSTHGCLISADLVDGVLLVNGVCRGAS